MNEAVVMRNTDNSRKGLLDLIQTNFKDRDNLIALEIGSYAGESAQLFLSTGKFKEIYCIDPWQSDYDPSDPTSKTVVYAEEVFDRRFKDNPRVHKLKGFSQNLVPTLQNNFFDFIYVDGNHQQQAVIQDLGLVIPKLKSDGILAGHDYNSPVRRVAGVTRAVNRILGQPPQHTFADTSWSNTKPELPNVLTVLHRGKCGDLIALCAWLREQHSNQRAHIYIREHRSFHKQDVVWIAPLLLQQPYIEKVGVCQQLSDVEPVNDIPCNLNLAREQAKNNHSYTAWWVDEDKWWQEVGVIRNETDLRDRVPLAYNELLKDNSPWLKVPPCEPYIKEPYVVISVTPRYGCMFDLSSVKVLADKYKIIFLGHQHNWLASGASSYSQFCNVSTSIQQAQVIRDCSLFIGTQTLQAWLAQSQGVDRIVSISPKYHDTTLRVEKGFKASINNKEELERALQEWTRAS